jgi:excisionase family DNA binding protein
MKTQTELDKTHDEAMGLLTTREVAKMFSVSEQTVRKWFRSGELPYLQKNGIIRVTREAVQQFIAANEAARKHVVGERFL